jgi:hypothetical protein
MENNLERTIKVYIGSEKHLVYLKYKTLCRFEYFNIILNIREFKDELHIKSNENLDKQYIDAFNMVMDYFNSIEYGNVFKEENMKILMKIFDWLKYLNVLEQFNLFELFIDNLTRINFKNTDSKNDLILIYQKVSSTTFKQKLSLKIDNFEHNQNNGAVNFAFWASLGFGAFVICAFILNKSYKNQ